MTEAEKKMKKYLKAVKRKLNLPSDVKSRVMHDFISSIQSRKEAGKTDAEIFAELGAPSHVAADLNEQMKEFAYIKSPWRWACFALVVLCVLMLLHGGIRGLLAAALTNAENASMGIIGGADGPTAIFVTTSGDFWLYQTGITLLLLAMGVLGFLALSRIRQNGSGGG